MKVTTDSCLFGAVVAKEISKKRSLQVLDAGTGTGLLSLMVAQENKEATIDAVEIDAAAAIQAKENIAATPWSTRMNVVQGDILQYQSAFLYDVVISNPPFYEQQLTSPNAGRNQVHHSSELTLLQLFQQVQQLLTPAGSFYVLLPFYRKEEVIRIAKSNSLYVEKQWLVRQTPKHGFFRAVFCFGKIEIEPAEPDEIIIRNEMAEYTAAFSTLLRPYYLHL